MDSATLPRSVDREASSAIGYAPSALAPAADWHDAGAHDHFVHFYDDDASLVAVAGGFLGDALASGACGIVIATGAHLAALERAFEVRGIDVAAARERGRYAALDARATLAAILVEGWPDARRFGDTIGSLVAGAVDRESRVVAFGEMVALLCGDGRHAAAVRLEALWNDLAREHRFALCCAYPTGDVACGPDDIVREICAQHTLALPTGRYRSLATENERLAYICEVEQDARRLAQEVAHRRATERLLAAREHDLSDFLESAPQAIHSVGADGLVLWANRHELDLLGYTAEEYVGRPIADFYVDPAVAARILRRLHAGETLRDEPAQMRRKDGSVLHVRVTSNARHENGGWHTRCFTRDVTEQVRAEQALRESQAGAQQANALLAAIVSCSDDAIVSKSLDGRISSWNAGAERLFGYTAAEAIGQSILMIVPPEGQDEERRILAALARGEPIDHFETVRVAKDGRRIEVALTISPIRDRDGRIVGASKVARDISERKRIEAEMRVADRRKDEFIAMLGHELRNPLAPIRTVTEVLRRTVGGNPECVHLCGILERQVQQMTRLLDDLLDVTRITRGKIRFKREPTDIGTVVQHAVEAARPLLERHRHQLAVDVPSGALPVQGDFERLVQLATNLLSNAAKYTPDGGRIGVRVVRRKDAIAIHVRDNGVGISAGMLPRVFELFVQDEAYGGMQDGLGVGLALVRIIAEHHGGGVKARSAGLGRGSEFVVTLPAAEAGDRAAMPTPASSAAAPRKRIVIVDDNRDASSSLAMLLRLGGHDVEVAADGASAIALVQDIQPDLALLDIGLPGMSGYEVARRLRQAGCAVPLAAITGYGTPEDRERSRAAGFDHHFVKPIDPASLDRLLASTTQSATR